MEKDNSVRNQKVFVRMESVFELQRQYLAAVDKYRVEKERERSGNKSDLAATHAAKRIHEQIIKTLDLPIQIESF